MFDAEGFWLCPFCTFPEFIELESNDFTFETADLSVDKADP
jgi:hypothetical protein